MKKMIFMMAAAAICGMTSCQKDDNCPAVENVKANAAVPLTIHATIGGEQTRAFSEKKTPWQAGDKLGIFVLNQNDENAFPGTTLNLPFTYDAIHGWTNPATISISDKLPRVCAYYPQDAAKKDVKAVPFNTESDFLYSTPVVPVISASNADVRMVMKHALTQFKFEISKDASYKGPGNITKLTISKVNGEMWKDGTMNLLKGTFTGKTTANEFKYDVNQNLSGTSPVAYGAAVMPTKGDFKLTIVIDGRNYECPFKADWKMGTRNTYPFTLKATELTIGNGENGDGKGNQITIEDWTNADKHGALNLTPVK